MTPGKWLLVGIVSLAATNKIAAQIGVMPQKDTTLPDAKDDKFKVGDVWGYATRGGEENSTVTILKIDRSPELGMIVQIAVDKIRLANCHSGPSPESVPHMPFSRRALDGSVTKKIASKQPLPDYRGGGHFCAVALYNPLA